MRPYVSVYRKLLLTALRVTWKNRVLWLFGFLAGILETGAIALDVFRLAPVLKPGTLSWQTLEEGWNALALGQTFLAHLANGDTVQILATLLYLGGGGIILVLLMVSAQHLVLATLNRHAMRKKNLHWRDVTRELTSIHACRLLSLDVLGRIALLVVLLTGSLVIRTLIGNTPSATFLVTTATYLVVLPLAFSVNAVTMLALLRVTSRNENVGQSILGSIAFFRSHILATTEFAALLFVANALLTGLLLVGLIFGSQLALTVSLLKDWSLFFHTVFGTLLAVAIGGGILLVMGGMTVLNYSAWTLFAAKCTATPVHPRSEHVVHRIRKAFAR